MNVDREARLWQLIGGLAVLGGAVMLLVLFYLFGVVRTPNLTTLATGLAASFMMLAGIAGYVFGRVLHHMAYGYQHREAVLWRLLGSVCCAAGACAVLYAAYTSADERISLNHLTEGLAGAFFIMTGVICLLGNRVMYHENAKFTGGKPVSAKAASA